MEISLIRRIIKLSIYFRQNEFRYKSILKDEFDQIIRSGQSYLSPVKSKQLLEKLHNSIVTASHSSERKKQTATLLPANWSILAAASITIVIAVTAWHYSHPATKSPDLVSSHSIMENAVIVKSNKGEDVRMITLSDNSIVRLSPGSSISYYPSFNTGKRNISLVGKATFEVSKDSTRPFIVYASEINIRVLGTIFMVNAAEQNKVYVKLFEGKVMIHFVTKKMSKRQVKLQAGQYFIIDKKLGQFKVAQFKESLNISGNKTVLSESHSSEVALEFNQEPLANVLDRIGKRYKVQFKFNKTGFNNMLVTGKFLPSDSLPMILYMIGNINNLSFKEQGNKIEVVTRLQ